MLYNFSRYLCYWKLPIKSGCSNKLGTIEKEINENYLGTN